MTHRARLIVAPLALTLGAWLAACSPKPPSPPPPMPPPGPYVLQPGDKLAVRFNRNPELNETVVVRPDGMISLQLIEDVPAAGQTSEALGAELRQRYAGELAHPEVKVIVKTFSSHRVSVSGEVTDPGVQPLLAGLTLSQAIHHAGGFLKTADRRQVVVIRHHADRPATGHIVDLKQVEEGDDPTQDIALHPLDQVWVPKSDIAKVNVMVEQYLKNNIPVNSIGLGLTPF